MNRSGIFAGRSARVCTNGSSGLRDWEGQPLRPGLVQRAAGASCQLDWLEEEIAAIDQQTGGRPRSQFVLFLAKPIFVSLEGDREVCLAG